MSRVNASDSQVEQGAHVPNHHSTFPMGNNQFITCRFGEYVPFFVFDSYEKDKVRQRSVTTTRSLSLKAPLMEDINLKRDYFQVYYDALLPINWDKCYVRPKHGDIVDWQKCSTNVAGFPDKIRSLVMAYTGEVIPEDIPVSPFAMFNWLVFLEMFYSDGALINHFGAHMSPIFKATFVDSSGNSVTTNFDKFFDYLCGLVVRAIDPSSAEYSPLSAVFSDEVGTFYVTSAGDLRFLLQHFRENRVTSISWRELPESVNNFWYDFSFTINDLPYWSFNLAPLWAYQIACAHFYSDDNVDYVFSAELFRSYIGSLIVDSLASYLDSARAAFYYNGLTYLYDNLSSFYFDTFVEAYLDGQNPDFAYFRALFGFNRSLRYQDYFSGARTAPIAVGDETVVTATDGTVSVIDITQSIQWQRLLNNIQRLPQELGRYIKAATGKDQSFDYHNPGWLAHTKDTVFAAEVENTGGAQMTEANSVTATLRGKSSDKEFTFQSDRPCIIIGIQYFDIRRAYYTGVRRTLMLESREDMFMPELQYIGDQPIYQDELVSYAERVRNFGYTEQYNWLKTNYDEAMGGFVNDSLPGWAFLFKPDFFLVNARGDVVISPNFIRSMPQELDEFFLSLSGFSLGTYFHFQQKIVNITSASRNMVRHSQILQ